VLSSIPATPHVHQSHRSCVSLMATSPVTRLEPELSMFSPTREEGLAQLRHFAPRAGRFYAENRNTDEGGIDRKNVSLLSPYLRHRLITEEEVLSATLFCHSLAQSEKFVQEVFWRAYFKGYLETRPFIWDSYVSALPPDASHPGYISAIGARTDIDCFDHWVNELTTTGYLHNHARMWFASIWIFTLKLPWAWGADFMYAHLLDGDPASNTLSWRWVAGLHTRGKTYLARPDNIARYTNGRFQPKGLAAYAEPLDEAPSPPPHGMPQALSEAPDGRYGLLVTEEDLSPESLFQSPAPCAIAVTNTPWARLTEFNSKLVQDFTTKSLDDAATRLASHWNTNVDRIALTVPALVDWCKAQELTILATAYAPVGPVADALQVITRHLQSNGISLLRVRRRFDTLCWPHATKGFFALQEKIPGLLTKLNITTAQPDLF
jgi:deoxyribodipyrimidine photo-lyase